MIGYARVIARDQESSRDMRLLDAHWREFDEPRRTGWVT
jgi:hypothetical protein